MNSKKFFKSIMDDSQYLSENVTRTEEAETEPAKKMMARKKLDFYLERKRLRKLLTFFH